MGEKMRGAEINTVRQVIRQHEASFKIRQCTGMISAASNVARIRIASMRCKQLQEHQCGRSKHS